MASRIEDYALIGDLRDSGTRFKKRLHDWLCWPRFDSAACFAALLGNADNGRWQIAPPAVGPEAKVQIKRRKAEIKAIMLKVKFIIAELAVMAPQWAFVRTNSSGTQKINVTGATSVEANQELFILRKTTTANGGSPVTLSLRRTRWARRHPPCGAPSD